MSEMSVADVAKVAEAQTRLKSLAARADIPDRLAIIAVLEEMDRRAHLIETLREHYRQLTVVAEAIGHKARSGEIPRFWEDSAVGGVR